MGSKEKLIFSFTEFWFKIIEMFLLTGVVKYISIHVTGILQFIFAVIYATSLLMLFVYILGKFDSIVIRFIKFANKILPQEYHKYKKKNNLEIWMDKHSLVERIFSGIFAGLFIY